MPKDARHPVPLSEVRELAERHSLPRIVVFFEAEGDRFGFTSYGADRKLCGSAQRLGNRLWNQVRDFFVAERERGL